MSPRLPHLLLLLALPLMAAEPTPPPATDPDTELDAPDIDPERRSTCQQWAQIARGIYLAKAQGQPKRQAQSVEEKHLLDYIYGRRIASSDAAHVYALKACAKFNTQRLQQTMSAS